MDKKELFWSETVFLGQKVHYYIVYIAYYTELNLHNFNYAQKQRIWRNNSKYALDKICMAIFALTGRLQTSATLPNVQTENGGDQRLLNNVKKLVDYYLQR